MLQLTQSQVFAGIASVCVTILQAPHVTSAGAGRLSMYWIGGTVVLLVFEFAQKKRGV